ncbi:MAG: hypothetical protein ACKV2Q_13670 [Planctomycetaceae bacterium]
MPTDPAILAQLQTLWATPSPSDRRSGLAIGVRAERMVAVAEPASSIGGLAGIVGRRDGRTDRLVSKRRGESAGRAVRFETGGRSAGVRSCVVVSVAQPGHRHGTDRATGKARNAGRRLEMSAESGLRLMFRRWLCSLRYIMPKKMPITDLLRQTIQERGIPFLTLEQETGVLRQSLMKFARGESTIHLDSADALADYFGLALGPATKPKRKGK